MVVFRVQFFFFFLIIIFPVLVVFGIMDSSNLPLHLNSKSTKVTCCWFPFQFTFPELVFGAFKVFYMVNHPYSVAPDRQLCICVRSRIKTETLQLLRKKWCAAQIRRLYSVQLLSFSSTVSSDAVILVAEMLKVFVEGKANFTCTGIVYLMVRYCVVQFLFQYFSADYLYATEATRRAVKQANSEDCDTIDIEHFEKILPQLVSFVCFYLFKMSVVFFFFCLYYFYF